MSAVEPYCNGIGCPDRLRTTCHHFKEKINYKKEINWGILPYDEKRDICTQHQDHHTKFSYFIDEYIKNNSKTNGHKD